MPITVTAPDVNWELEFIVESQPPDCLNDMLAPDSEMAFYEGLLTMVLKLEERMARWKDRRS